jgi:formyl-CoA transferase
MAESTGRQSGPLAGIAVVEVASFIAGPYVGMLLADLGADVIKVETPGTGDPFREWGEDRGASPQFAAFNRNKRSVECDLKSETGRRQVDGLLASADVLIENFRPGKTAALGLDYEQVHRRHPRLLYCSVTGLGPTGPASQQPAYDAIVQARSGLWSLLTDRGAPEAIGPALSDQIVGLFATQAIVAALLHRERNGGNGQLIEVNMLAASLAFLTASIAEHTMTGTVDGPYTRPHRSQSFAFLARDQRPLAVHLSSPPKFWKGLLAATGLEHLADDPRFATKSDRIRHYDVLKDLIGAVFATRDRDEWLDRLWALDVPAAPIHDIAEALVDLQAEELQMLREYGNSGEVVRLVRYPATFSETPCTNAGSVPRLGEHNEWIEAGETAP